MSVQSDIKEIISDIELVNSFSHKSVLVTGATGLIGSMIIKTLVCANSEYGLNIKIIGLARNEERAKKVLGDAADQVSMLYSDGFNVDSDCDYIFHTASPTSSKYFIECPVETINTILAGTKAMLELAKKRNAVIVYLSSMEAYGVPYVPGQVMTEDKIGVINHLTVRSCYPEAKRMCECMCAAYSSEFGVSAKIVRLAQTFGAGVPLQDNRVSMQFAKSVVEGNNIVLHTEGKSISNFCYLTDAIAGILTVAVKGEKGEAYNVCNDGESRSIFDIANLVAGSVAEGKISVIKDIPDTNEYGFAPDNTMRLCSDKLLSLGWSPKVNMEEGYKRLVEYLKAQGWNN